MSFDIHSNFDKRANFTEVKFGEGKPVLEVELNELQNIQNEARADLIRDSIPSGFTSLGELDFAYSAENENVIRLKSDSVAYVNGYRILLPKDMTIDLGEAPKDKPREDLVFLEVWKEEVNYEDTLHVQGGENLGTMTNPIKDSRYPIETSRRIVLKWRIRVQQNVDFNKYVDGFATSYSPKYWNDINPEILPQGALSSPTKLILGGLSNWVSSKIREGTTQSNLASIQGDTGVYAGGLSTRTTLETIDGFVYAIPMFRIHRKPSCGKASPFEYSKINPKVDYDKFSALVNEDKVERVLNENIKGETLVNLVSYNPSELVSSANYVHTRKNYTSFNLVEGRTYTLICLEEGDKNYVSTLSIQDPNDASNYLLSNAKGKVASFVAKSNYSAKELCCICQPTSEKPFPDSYGKYISFLVLEGDLTNRTIPKSYFKGMLSLGEAENNVIEVKTEVLDNKTYDPCTGNVKLSSAPNVTHVMTDNAIRPTFVAEVKRGETKVSDLTEFKKLDTQGNETIDFTKIKGKTLQNLIKNKWSIASSTTDALKSESISNGVKITKVKETLTWAYALFGGDFVPFLKPSTIYTFFINIKSSTTLANSLTYNICSSNGLNSLGTVTFNKLTGDTYVCKYTSPETIVAQNQGLYISLSGYPINSWLEVSNLILIEGDYVIDNIPYFPNMSSVGESEDNTVIVKSCGKNMFNMYDFCDMLKPYDKYAEIKEIDGNECILFSGYSYHQYSNVHYLKGKFKPNTPYTFSGYSKRMGDRSAVLLIVRYTDSTEEIIDNTTTSTWKQFSKVSDKSKTVDSILISFNYKEEVGAFHSIQVEEGDNTNFEPYNDCTQEIHLKEPLRSLPNGVCDEIVGNKVIRRVGKYTFDGSNAWLSWGSENSPTHCNGYLYVNNKYGLDLGMSTSSVVGLCDTLPIIGNTYSQSIKAIGLGVTSGYVSIGLPLTEVGLTLESPKEAYHEAIKTWLKKNPTTIYYELATPIIDEIEHYYEKESVKTYQLDAPLRRVNNNTYDEIKNGVLIRRCGDFIIDGTKSMNFRNEGDGVNTISIDCAGISSEVAREQNAIISDKFATDGSSSVNGIEGIGISANGSIFIEILRSKLSTPDLDGFKEWIKNNPIKVIYKLDVPREIKLVEARPNTSDFSFNRQFKDKDGNYLRELPNGTKDTIENNKVIRRVGKLTLNGSENWEVHSNDSNSLYRYYLTIDTLKPLSYRDIGRILCDSLPVHLDLLSEIWAGENIHVRVDGTKGGIYIVKNDLSDLVTFKSWLAKYPVTILYELTTPTEEVLTTKNCTYFPYHGINTHLGSLYVTDGNVHTNINSIIPKTEDVVIETEFREITGKDLISDCHYKKHYDGSSDYVLKTKGKNLFVDDISQVARTWQCNCKFEEDKIHIRPTNTEGVSYATVQLPKLQAGKSYTISIFKDNQHCVDALPWKRGTTTICTEIAKPFKVVEGTNDVIDLGMYVDNSNLNNEAIFRVQIEEGGATQYAKPEVYVHYYSPVAQEDTKDLRHKVSLTGFDYHKLLDESFKQLLTGNLDK